MTNGMDYRADFTGPDECYIRFGRPARVTNRRVGVGVAYHVHAHFGGFCPRLIGGSGAKRVMRGLIAPPCVWCRQNGANRNGITVDFA